MKTREPNEICFPALTSLVFRAFHRLHFLPCFLLVTRCLPCLLDMFSGYPALATRTLFSRANTWFPVDPCLSLANKCFLCFTPNVVVSCFDWLFFFSSNVFRLVLNQIGFSSEIELRPLLTFSCIFSRWKLMSIKTMTKRSELSQKRINVWQKPRRKTLPTKKRRWPCLNRELAS